MPDEQLIVFVKAPRPGAVKSRLAKTMGAAAACTAYCRLVETVMRNLSQFENVELRFTPDDAALEIKPWLRPGWHSLPQGGGDLGDRMHRAFAEHFSAGSKRVVIIGSDCPDVTPADIREAWKELKNADLVLGPATDGGYWLIGLRRPEPTGAPSDRARVSVFEGISWGSDSVLAETLQRAKAANLPVGILRILTDVDTEQEWREFVASSP